MITMPIFTTNLPSWIVVNINDEQLEAFTPDDWQRLTVELNAYNKAVQDYNKAIKLAANDFISLAKKIYGVHHKVPKYLNEHPPCAAKCEVTLLHLKSRYKELCDDTIEREKQQAEDNLLVKAAVFLTQNGKIEGVDYKAEHTIASANNLRFYQLMNEKLVTEGGPVDFSGQNCDSCDGWDGTSRRCECGNRRVDWVSQGDFTNMYIYGEAY